MRFPGRNFVFYAWLVLGVLAGVAAFSGTAYAQCSSIPDDGSFNCAAFTPPAGGTCVTPQYMNSIATTESGGQYNCVNSIGATGAYQFMDTTRQNICSRTALPCVSRAAFANCPALQNAYFQAFNQLNWQSLQNCGATNAIGTSINGIPITQGCLLAMAHLGGAGGACNYVNSGGSANPCDAYGTCLSSYCQTHGGVTNAINPSGGACTVPTFTPGPAPVPPPAPAPTLPTITDTFLQCSGICNPCTQCSGPQTVITKGHIRTLHTQTRAFITDQFRMHQNWLFGANTFFQNGSRDNFWELHVQPALMMMTEQLVTTGMEQMLILGTFFDAEIQLDTQRLIQKKAAEAHKDYHPSYDMCAIGTNARSLAAADRNGEFTAFVLGQRAQDREIGMFTANAAYSAAIEREGRVNHTKGRYCDPNDNDGKLGTLCGPGAVPPETVNRDIDYTRTIDGPRTLNIDFTDNTATADEQDVLAIASNLFSHDVLDKPGRTALGKESGEGVYLAMRGLTAKRNVVQNSFNAIVGLKTAGSQVSQNTLGFSERVLEQFGVTNAADRQVLLSGTQDDGVTPAGRPSYFAQMELLAQRLYMDPEFYTNLYDKPANIARKAAAMQAINLMLERDMYKSELRSEMVYSVLLELELMKYQDDVQNRLNALTEKNQEN